MVRAFEDMPSSYFFNSSLGYKVYRRDTPQDPHGGVLLAVIDDIEVLDIDKHKELELITGCIKIGKQKMILASYYRPPDKSDEDYVSSVQTELLRLKSKNQKAIFIIGGDFNVPDIDWFSHKITGSSYQSSLFIHCYGYGTGTAVRFSNKARKYTGPDIYKSS